MCIRDRSETVQKRTAEALGMSSLSGYKSSVEAGTTTRVISISVTAGKPDAAAIVANEISTVLSTTAQSVMGVESVNVVDAAEVPTDPSGPPRAMYTAVAFLAGIFLAVAIVVVLDMLNTRVRNPEEAEEPVSYTHLDVYKRQRLAQRWGVTLVGFAKRDVFNVYAHPERIV